MNRVALGPGHLARCRLTLGGTVSCTFHAPRHAPAQGMHVARCHRVRPHEDGVERFAGEGAPARPVGHVLLLTRHSKHPERCVLIDDMRLEKVAE